jgi:FAD/FMN-containing dehydrogenase
MEIEAALERIKVVVGPRGWIAEPADQEPYLVEARRLWRGATRLVVRPASTAEVAAVVRICAEARLPIVPQGGTPASSAAASRPRMGPTSSLLSAARTAYGRSIRSILR